MLCLYLLTRIVYILLFVEGTLFRIVLVFFMTKICDKKFAQVCRLLRSAIFYVPYYIYYNVVSFKALDCIIAKGMYYDNTQTNSVVHSHIMPIASQS